MKNPFRILSIDGGGIKGIFPATFLEKFEERYSFQVCEKFDLICGTSTGGIIALGLAKGLKAGEIKNLYCDRGAEIFEVSTMQGRIKNKMGMVNQAAFGKYTGKMLKKVLQEVFGDTKVKDVKTNVCIPSYCMSWGEPVVFKNDHSEGLGRDGNTLLSDVALATSAAPTYFPIHAMPNMANRMMVDGGLWANNPTLIGLLEAIRFFCKEGSGYDGIQILSIGNVKSHHTFPPATNKKKGFLSWQEKLFDAIMTGQSQFNDYFMKTLLGSQGFKISVDYERIEADPLSAENQKKIGIDKVTFEAITLLKQAADKKADLLLGTNTLERFLTSRQGVNKL